MPQPGDPSEPAGAGDPPPEPPAEDQAWPWEAEPLREDPDAPRQRHDAFTDAKKRAFLTALAGAGSILDACRAVGVAPRTVYRHHQDDPRFFDNCATAIRMSATPLELTAWQRAVEGVEQEFACGGQVHVRRRYDGSLLRLLLQGSNPKKYGARPGFKRKRILRHERKQMEREIRAELKAKASDRMSFDDAMVRLDSALDALAAREEPIRLAAGWTKSEDGHWIPPGYAPIPGWTPLPPPAGGAEPPRDSM
jgi:hypothetical protein